MRARHARLDHENRRIIFIFVFVVIRAFRNYAGDAERPRGWSTHCHKSQELPPTAHTPQRSVTVSGNTALHAS